jgi:hypothetical protein
MKRKFRLSQIIKKEELLIGLLILACVYLFDYHCLFRSLFHIPCAGCGITRAFEMLLHFNVMGSIRYNLLAFPIVLYVLVLFTQRIVDAIKGTHKADMLEKPVMTPTLILFLIILVSISWTMNMVRGL